MPKEDQTADVIDLHPEPVKVSISSGILETMRQAQSQSQQLRNQLGELRATYLQNEAAIVSEIRKAERTFAAAAQNALLAADMKPEANLKVDVDLAEGTISKVG